MKKYFFAYMLATLISFATILTASTGYPNEITNIHVENVTQTSVDVVWTTLHPSDSTVLLARDMNYQPERVYKTLSTATTSNITTSHRVTLDKLWPGTTYYYYVASNSPTVGLSTNPGPDLTFLSFTTTNTDSTLPTSMVIYPMGATNVYAGHSLYVYIPAELISGASDSLYITNHSG